MRTIYFAITTHPNMNYDRSRKSVIWETFPQFYRLYLNYLAAHPALRSHMQLPAQTLLSLKRCGPDVLALAQELQARGQLRFMGTFFSEPLAQCMDGMSVLESAELGCRVSREELGVDLEGFFLQEIAYTPQLPYVINKLGVQWLILKDWDEENDLKPYWVEGLDGSRCIGVPMLEAARLQQLREHPDLIPDDALFAFHCDMEFPNAIKRAHDLSRELAQLPDTRTVWCFVSDYVAEVGVSLVKRPTPCTNKPQDTTASPSHSRWVSDPLDMRLHQTTMAAFEARRAAVCMALATGVTDLTAADAGRDSLRPYAAWDVESLADYPEVGADYHSGASGALSALDRMAQLLAWATNSDARGWYPLFERRVEREDSFAEAIALGASFVRQAVASGAPVPRSQRSGLYAINPNPELCTWTSFVAGEPLDVVDPRGRNVVQLVRRCGSGWEHLCRLALPAYSYVSLGRHASVGPRLQRPEEGDAIGTERLSVAATAEGVTIRSSGCPDMALDLAPFRLCVKHLDRGLREPRPEGLQRCSVISGPFPRLIVERQLDYHVHFRAEYVLDAAGLFVDWRFLFTAPTLVEAEEDEATFTQADFEPGGLCARLRTGTPGDVFYDVPFGTSRHPNAAESFIAPLSHAFLAHPDRGVALVSQSGSQSFKVNAGAGELGVCMGRSTTSGGRRNMGFRIGDSITDFKHDVDWYKELFHGEHRHRFVVMPFAGDWRAGAVPVRARALATRPRLIEAASLVAVDAVLAVLNPANVRIAGADPGARRLVLNEMCGLESDYELSIGGHHSAGRIRPFQILELGLG